MPEIAGEKHTIAGLGLDRPGHLFAFAQLQGRFSELDPCSAITFSFGLEMGGSNIVAT